MPASDQFAAYVVDQLSRAGSITSRKMFGGVGIYIDGVFCAIVGSSNRFYLRVGDSNVDDYQREGMEKFSGRKGSSGMPYYEVPEHVLEDEGVLREWALKAREAAVAAKRN